MDAERAEHSSAQGHHFHHVQITGGKVFMGNAIMGAHQSLPDDLQKDQGQVIMDTLRYDNMNAREQHLNQESFGPASFNWIWDTPITEWLKRGETMFWIAGKPASGKSTLMNFLSRDHRTVQHLSASGEKWKLLRFFFDFRAGSSTANQTQGMIRSLLCQLATSLTRFFETLGRIQKRETLAMSLFGTDQLVKLICDVLEDSEYRCCAFIDGLDEFEGDAFGLIETLEKIQSQSGLKLCLASRQLYPFTELFQGVPKIEMQSYNDSSMDVYICTAIIKARRARPDIQSRLTDELKNDIIIRSQGVLLWTKLVVDELIGLATAMATSEELSRVLETIPLELEDLYQRVLDKIDVCSKTECAILLRLLVLSNIPVTLAVLLAVLRLSLQNIPALRSYKTMAPLDFQAHICFLLAPLTDVIFDQSNHTHEVRLMHKTLKTYLLRKDPLQDLYEAWLSQWNADHLWLDLLRDVANYIVMTTPPREFMEKLLKPEEEDCFRSFAIMGVDDSSLTQRILNEYVRALQATLSFIESETRDEETWYPYSLIQITLQQEILRFLKLAYDWEKQQLWLLVHEKMIIVDPAYFQILCGYSKIIDAMTAVLWPVTSFVAKRIKVAPFLSNGEKQILLDLSFVLKPFGSVGFGWFRMLKVITSEGAVLRSTHMCFLMDLNIYDKSSWWNDLNQALSSSSQNNKSQASLRSHTQFYRSVTKNASLLVEWVNMSTDEGKHVQDYYNSERSHVSRWLEVLIAHGQDINVSYSTQDCVLASLFTIAPLELTYKFFWLFTKLTSLLGAGFRADTRSRLKTALKFAQKQQEGLKEMLELLCGGIRGEEQECRRNRHELTICISILEFAVKNAVWPDLEVYEQYLHALLNDEPTHAFLKKLEPPQGRLMRLITRGR